MIPWGEASGSTIALSFHLHPSINVEHGARQTASAAF